jgi:hypothetical protein
MDTDGAKQLVYRYNGIAQSDEVEVDLNGEKPIPQKDQVIVRNGKQWKIVAVNTEVSLNRSGPIPIVMVFLTDQF